MPRMKVGDRQVGLPRSRIARIAAGTMLILFGFLGFLPVLGFWMIPLGVMILSVDLPLARRLRRRSEVWLTRKRRDYEDWRRRRS